MWLNIFFAQTHTNLHNQTHVSATKRAITESSEEISISITSVVQIPRLFRETIRIKPPESEKADIKVW